MSSLPFANVGRRKTTQKRRRVGMLSDQNARNIAIDLAKWRSEDRISADDLNSYGYVIGESLTENPDMQEDAVLLHENTGEAANEAIKGAAREAP